MKKRKGPYTVLSSKVVYRNKWITVTHEEGKKDDGTDSVFGVIKYSKGASTVALDSNKDTYLIKEYGYAVEKEELKVPSGGIEKNETPLKAAKRELLEEAGVKSKEWIKLGLVDPLTMVLNGPAHLFLALGTEQVKGEVEPGIEVIKIPFTKAYEMVLESKITHAQSCVAILKAKIYLDKNKVFGHS